MKTPFIGELKVLPKNWRSGAEEIPYAKNELAGLWPGVYKTGCLASERLILTVIMRKKFFRITDQDIIDSIFKRCPAA